MIFEEHERACMREFGKPFTLVHLWLDQYWDQYRWYHRIILHHRLGVELLVMEMGEDVRRAAEQHIRLDLEGEYPADWSFYMERNSDYMKPEYRESQEKEFRRLYGDTLFEEREFMIL